MKRLFDNDGVEMMELSIDNGTGPAIVADLRSPDPSEKFPLVIASHGFLGYRRWGFFPYLSSRIASAGFHVLTFSFSHCGVDESTGRIAHPEIFASNSVSREIEDLCSVCSFARSKSFPFPVDESKWGLLGHSRGGAVSILSVSRCPEVKSIVTWSALSKLDRYTLRRKKDWKKTGRLPFNEQRADSQLWLDYSYFEDIERNLENYDLERRASEMGIPHLIVHGRHDGAVTLQEAQGLLRYDRDAEVRMEIIEGCGHSFATVHPMQKPSAALEKAVSLSVEWFLGTLTPLY